MSRKALHPRIESEARATVLASKIAQPIQNLIAKSLGSLAFERHQIIHIKEATIGQIVHQTRACNGNDLLIFGFQAGQKITGIALPMNSLQELIFVQMSSQFPDYRKSAGDVRIVFGDKNSWHDSN